MTYSNCRSCGAPIIWTRTWAGKAMPVDEEPIHGGNILVSPDGTATVIDGHLEMWPDEPRYVTACPGGKRDRIHASRLRAHPASPIVFSWEAADGDC